MNCKKERKKKGSIKANRNIQEKDMKMVCVYWYEGGIYIMRTENIG